MRISLCKPGPQLGGPQPELPNPTPRALKATSQIGHGFPANRGGLSDIPTRSCSTSTWPWHAGPAPIPISGTRLRHHLFGHLRRHRLDQEHRASRPLQPPPHLPRRVAPVSGVRPAAAYPPVSRYVLRGATRCARTPESPPARPSRSAPRSPPPASIFTMSAIPSVRNRPALRIAVASSV